MKVTKANGLNTTPIWPSRFGQSAQRATCYAVLHRTGGSLGDSARYASPEGAGRIAKPPECRHGGAKPPKRLGQIGVVFKALCFGDFHLGPQMFAKRGAAHFAQRSYAATKVTRPPGRDPARRHEPVIQRTKRNVRNGPKDDLHSTPRFVRRGPGIARWSN
ncbi:hypothetical protein [Piscinibacter sp.]|uniref:hypothetical protein n=1 Tax=Piscinibacter sp. TaxID=1903157 RepID=UPI002F403A3F